ncbi:hypothetical protein FQR65_LT19838 [Abscondita terminalis]|nr:hypothetical protein FQR65_LT19838 [Abscondita terminalis]
MIVADVAALREFSNDPNDLIYYKICIKKNTNMIVNQDNLKTLPASNTSQMENSTPFGGSESEIDKQWIESAYGDTLLNEIECPECPWKLFGWCKDEEIVDLIGHIRNKHASFLIKTNHNYSIRVGITTALYAAITPENELLIIFCDGAEQLKINFIHVINRGINKTKSTYKYKLEFCDKTGGNLEFIISKLCQIIQPIDRSSAFKKCLSIPQEMIEPFVIKNPVPKVYQIHIEKI